MDKIKEIRRFFLLQVNDALFPIGGYSHSQGLETYIQQGIVHDEKTAADYIRRKLKLNLACTDLLGVRLAYEYALKENVAALDDLEEIKRERFHSETGMLVAVHFILEIEGVLKSEFVNIMSVELARELLAGFGMGIQDTGEAEADATPAAQPAQPEPSSGAGGKLSQEEIERLMGGGVSTPAPEPAAAPSSSGKMSQEEIERLMGSMSAAPAPEPAPQRAQAYQAASPQPVYQQPVYQPPVQEPRVINSKPVALPNFAAAESLGAEQKENLELIMSVPLEVSVEIGRTRRKVEDILTFSKGSLVVLDKLAGDQVDVFVNGLCIARGDVVVIDDNFGVRITEVLQKPELWSLTNFK